MWEAAAAGSGGGGEGGDAGAGRFGRLAEIPAAYGAPLMIRPAFVTRSAELPPVAEATGFCAGNALGLRLRPRPQRGRGVAGTSIVSRPA